MIRMKVLYYPGCSLRGNYQEFEKSTIESCRILGVELIEIPRWTCCGVNPSLATDNMMRHLGAIRSLIKAREKGLEIGSKTVVAACSMCYNVLKKVNLTLREDPDKLETVNSFLDEEPDYIPELRVVHLLTLLKELGFENIQRRIVNPLRGLRVAPYYGCVLLRPDRPKGIPIDDPVKPTIFEDLLRSLGAEPVEYPFKTECCGNYHVVFRPDIVEMRSKKIVSSAKHGGADIIVSSCPLCLYNLNRGNEALAEEERVPVIFFTQLLSLAMGGSSYLPKDLENLIMCRIRAETNR